MSRPIRRSRLELALYAKWEAHLSTPEGRRGEPPGPWVIGPAHDPRKLIRIPGEVTALGPDAVLEWLEWRKEQARSRKR